MRHEGFWKYVADQPFFPLSAMQDFSLIISRPLLRGGWGVLFAELVVNPDEVGKKKSKQDGPYNDPEKVIIAS
jgi:hypothetical protein